MRSMPLLKLMIQPIQTVMWTLVGFYWWGFTPKYNPEYGLQDSWEDKTEIVELASELPKL